MLEPIIKKLLDRGAKNKTFAIKKIAEETGISIDTLWRINRGAKPSKLIEKILTKYETSLK